MSLQFNPPTDIINEYINRKSSGQQASEGIQQALAGYLQMKAQQDKSQHDVLDTYVKAFEAGGPQFAGDIAKRIGLKNPPALPGQTAVQTPPGTVAGEPQMAGTTPPGSTNPVMSPHVQASIAAGHGNPTGFPMPDESLLAQGKFGKGLYDEQMKTAEVKTKYGKKAGVTKEQVLANGFDPTSQMVVEPPAPKDTSAQDQRYSNEQDRLERQAIDSVSRMRGDASVARTEVQRDAAIQAYNTIQRVKDENRLPSQLEYYDLLGQMWKARTGASPTDQALRDLDAKTFKGNLGKAYQYFSGKPAGVTTPEVLDNIQAFASDSGLQADKLHGGYMDAHKLKPSGLEDKRWQPIMASHRGLSFVDATGYKPKANPVSGQSYSDSAKEARYQAWKAKQGK